MELVSTSGNMMALIVISVMLGMYGSLVLLNMSAQLSYEPDGYKIDRILISTINIVVSIISIGIILYVLM